MDQRDFQELSAEILRLRLALREISKECSDYSSPGKVRKIARHALTTTPISKRGAAWLLFADQVFHHIEEYTVPQYGDAGSDQVTEWSGDDCAKQVNKYLGRRGRNARPGEEHRDMLKAAHYTQLTSEKDGAATRSEWLIKNADVMAPDVFRSRLGNNNELLAVNRCNTAAMCDICESPDCNQRNAPYIYESTATCQHCGAAYHPRYAHVCLTP